MSKRLEILEASLAKKVARFDSALAEHYNNVKQANGQPLNDKRNGAATLGKWFKQGDALRALNASIERTKAAIEREKGKIASVLSVDVPECLQPFIASGQVTQWRKHPRFFFVTGVDKARIVVTDTGEIAHRYLKQITDKAQYAIFRDVFNSANKAQRGEA